MDHRHAPKQSETLLDRVFVGDPRLIAQVRIEYRDGFRDAHRRKSDYAFRFEEGKWLSWPVWTVDDIAARYVEEQQRYPKPKLTCVFFAPTLVHF